MSWQEYAGRGSVCPTNLKGLNDPLRVRLVKVSELLQNCLYKMSSWNAETIHSQFYIKSHYLKSVSLSVPDIDVELKHLENHYRHYHQ